MAFVFCYSGADHAFDDIPAGSVDGVAVRVGATPVRPQGGLGALLGAGSGGTDRCHFGRVAEGPHEISVRECLCVFVDGDVVSGV